MNPSDAKERLTRLVDLAKQHGLSGRRALAGEITDLLLDWPANYPTNMREPFEALLERAIRDVDFRTRAALADRLASSDVPLAILNLLIFDAEPDTRSILLARNATSAQNATRTDASASALLADAQAAQSADLVRVLAERCRVPRGVAAQILADPSGFWLAILCKGLELGRAVFSALAILASPEAPMEESYKRLAAYDDAPEEGSVGLVAFWRDLTTQANLKAA